MLKYLIILLLSLGCYAQQIMPLRDKNLTKNVYFKDTFNDYDNFTGTWKYTFETTELTITLHKQAYYYNEFSQNYQDIVYGEYKYIENGVEKINTLPGIATVPADRYAHNIVGSLLARMCSTCPENQRRLILSFNDPMRAHVKGLVGKIALRRVDSNGQQKLEMQLRNSGNISLINGNPPEFDQLTVPFGTYVLVKQP